MKKKTFTNWKEARRLRAIELFRKGWKQVEICEALGATKGAISQWVKKYKNEGRKSLYSIPHRGAPCRLSVKEKNKIPELLWHGAEAYGFQGDIWTTARIRKIIKKEFGVTYHRRQVARIMQEIQWTSHRPIIRALQRNEKEINFWKEETWSEIKKSRKREKDSIPPR